MAEIKTDSEFDRQLDQAKKNFKKLTIDVKSFMATFVSLPAKERARKYQEIQRAFQTIQSFIGSANLGLVTNTGSKFGYQSLRQDLMSLQGRWRKFEKKMDGGDVE